MYRANQENIKALIPFLSTDATRPVLAHVIAKGGFLWATDGYKMARIAIEGNVDGPKDLGEIVSTLTPTKYGKGLVLVPIETDSQTPNVDTVWPKNKPTWSFEGVNDGKKRTCALSEIAANLALRGVLIDWKQLAALPEGQFTVSGTSTLSPVLFTGDGFEAVMMPLRSSEGLRKALEDVNKTALAV